MISLRHYKVWALCYPGRHWRTVSVSFQWLANWVDYGSDSHRPLQSRHFQQSSSRPCSSLSPCTISTSPRILSLTDPLYLYRLPNGLQVLLPKQAASPRVQPSNSRSRPGASPPPGGTACRRVFKSLSFSRFEWKGEGHFVPSTVFSKTIILPTNTFQKRKIPQVERWVWVALTYTSTLNLSGSDTKHRQYNDGRRNDA